VSRHCFALLLLLQVVAGCSKPTASEYFPKPKNGATWEYKLQFMSAVYGGGVQSGKTVIRFDGTETIRNQQYLRRVSVTTGIPGSNPKTRYYRYAPDGIYVVDPSDKDLREYLYIPLPIDVGRSWTTGAGSSHFSYHAESVETLELIDKKYESCLKITYKGRREDGEYEGTMWFAKGIGNVKEVTRFSAGILEMILEKHNL